MLKSSCRLNHRWIDSFKGVEVTTLHVQGKHTHGRAHIRSMRVVRGESETAESWKVYESSDGGRTAWYRSQYQRSQSTPPPQVSAGARACDRAQAPPQWRPPASEAPQPAPGPRPPSPPPSFSKQHASTTIGAPSRSPPADPPVARARRYEYAFPDSTATVFHAYSSTAAAAPHEHNQAPEQTARGDEFNFDSLPPKKNPFVVPVGHSSAERPDHNTIQTQHIVLRLKEVRKPKTAEPAEQAPSTAGQPEKEEAAQPTFSQLFYERARQEEAVPTEQARPAAAVGVQEWVLGPEKDADKEPAAAAANAPADEKPAAAVAREDRHPAGPSVQQAFGRDARAAVTEHPHRTPAPPPPTRTAVSDQEKAPAGAPPKPSPFYDPTTQLKGDAGAPERPVAEEEKSSSRYPPTLNLRAVQIQAEALQKSAAAAQKSSSGDRPKPDGPTAPTNIEAAAPKRPASGGDAPAAKAASQTGVEASVGKDTQSPAGVFAAKAQSDRAFSKAQSESAFAKAESSDSVAATAQSESAVANAQSSDNVTAKAESSDSVAAKAQSESAVANAQSSDNVTAKAESSESVITKAQSDNVVAKAQSSDNVTAKVPSESVIAKAQSDNVVTKAPSESVIAKAQSSDNVTAKAPSESVSVIAKVQLSDDVTAKAPSESVIAKAQSVNVVAKTQWESAVAKALSDSVVAKAKTESVVAKTQPEDSLESAKPQAGIPLSRSEDSPRGTAAQKQPARNDPSAAESGSAKATGAPPAANAQPEATQKCPIVPDSAEKQQLNSGSQQAAATSSSSEVQRKPAAFPHPHESQKSSVVFRVSVVKAQPETSQHNAADPGKLAGDAPVLPTTAVAKPCQAAVKDLYASDLGRTSDLYASDLGSPPVTDAPQRIKATCIRASPSVEMRVTTTTTETTTNNTQPSEPAAPSQKADGRPLRKVSCCPWKVMRVPAKVAYVAEAGFMAVLATGALFSLFYVFFACRPGGVARHKPMSEQTYSVHSTPLRYAPLPEQHAPPSQSPTPTATTVPVQYHPKEDPTPPSPVLEQAPTTTPPPVCDLQSTQQPGAAAASTAAGAASPSLDSSATAVPPPNNAALDVLSCFLMGRFTG
ncbi:hypothetical protein DIPPA_05921 [Diplonema papillatum]|nr:hypothetical protein DIPPA_05921 [Diplonema papillatum]